jgi:hypothetical protein
MRRANLLFAAICVSNAQGPWPHVNATLKDGKVTIRRVVVLPAQIALSKVGYHGPEGMAEESAQLSATIYTLVVAQLRARGVEILPNLAERATENAPKYAIADLQSKYNNVGVQLRKKLSGVEKGRYTLGDRVMAFEPGRQADALVFIRGKGTVMTTARTLKIGPGGSFDGDIGIVDAKSGDVLAFLRFVLRRNPIESPEARFVERLRDALREVPLPTAVPKT